MSLTYLYTKLRRSFVRLKLLELLQNNGYTLETLAEDLAEVIKSESESKIKETALIFDYLTLLDFDTTQDIDSSEVEEEVKQLLTELKNLIGQYEQRLTRKSRSLHFELPDIVVLEFSNVHPGSRSQNTYLTRKRQRG